MRKMAIFTFALLLCVGCEKSAADKALEELERDVEKSKKEYEKTKKEYDRLRGY